MSTQTVPSAPAVSRWSVMPGLFWAAMCLGILGWWMLVRDLRFAVPFYVGTWLVALMALSLFVGGVLGRLKAKGDPAQLDELEAKQRVLVAPAAMIGGIVLILLAVGLCFTERERLQVFAEVSTLAVLGVICLVAGLSLRQTGNGAFSQQSVLERLLALRPSLGIGLIGLGLILGGLGAFLFFKYRESFVNAGAIEGICLFLLGLAILGGGLWMQVTLMRPATTDTMRFLVLYLGSLTGFVIALYAALRFATWWDRYLSGGIRAWQGEDGWRFWLCAYIAIGGMVLLFVSLLLALTDIRTNVAMRRTLYGYNAFLMGFLLLVVMVLLNIIVTVVWPSNVQWTASLGMHSLSSRAEQTLTSLKDKVTVYVLLPRYDPTYLEVRDLLDNCRNVTNKLTVEEISPDSDEVRYRKLAKTYPKLEERSGGRGGGRGILITYGEAPEGKKLPHEFISEGDLRGSDGNPDKQVFKGEQILIQKIQQLSESDTEKPKLYFTQGHGEHRLDDADARGLIPSDRVLSQLTGIGEVVGRLRKDNYEVQALVWDTKRIGQPDVLTFSKNSAKDQHEVPDDCRVLVIVNPERPFQKDVLEAIDRYMDKQHGPAENKRPGKLMILSNTSVMETGKIADDGIIELCKKYNVDLGKDFILRYSLDRREEVIQIKATVPAGATNKAVTEFSKRAFTFILPRTVAPTKTPSNYQADTILNVTEDSNNGPVWGETEPIAVLDDPQLYMLELQKRNRLFQKFSTEPLPVGAAITDREGKPRGVILGDSTFISTFMMARSPNAAMNYDLFRSCLEWLSERRVQQIGISPKETGVFRISKDDVSSSRMILLPMGLLALALAGMGAGIWVVRRK